MPDILNNAKPISLETLYKILEQKNYKPLIDKFSFPIAIIDENTDLAFYICNDEVMKNISTESETILALLDNILQIPNPQDLILRLAAYQELFINYKKEYYIIFNRLKNSEGIDADDFIQQLGSNNESKN